MFFHEKKGIVLDECNTSFKREGFNTIDENAATDEQKIMIDTYKKSKEKEKMIARLKESAQKGTDNLAKYEAALKVPDELDPNKNYKLDLLDKKWLTITKEHLALEAEAIKIYWIDILSEI